MEYLLTYQYDEHPSLAQFIGHWLLRGLVGWGEPKKELNPKAHIVAKKGEHISVAICGEKVLNIKNEIVGREGLNRKAALDRLCCLCRELVDTGAAHKGMAK